MFKYDSIRNCFGSSFTELHNALFHMWCSIQNLIHNVINFSGVGRCKNKIDCEGLGVRRLWLYGG